MTDDWRKNQREREDRAAWAMFYAAAAIEIGNGFRDDKVEFYDNKSLAENAVDLADAMLEQHRKRWPV